MELTRSIRGETYEAYLNSHCFRFRVRSGWAGNTTRTDGLTVPSRPAFVGLPAYKSIRETSWIEVLQKWNSELRDCMKVDPQNRLQYFVTVDEVDGETLLRMMHFLQRHNTLKDFVNEDDAGKR